MWFYVELEFKYGTHCVNLIANIENTFECNFKVDTADNNRAYRNNIHKQILADVSSH